MNFYSGGSLKQHSAGRHVAPLGHIILIPSQPVFAFSPYNLNAACLVEKQYIQILLSLVWPDRGLNPQSTTLEASTLTSTQQMRFFGERRFSLQLITSTMTISHMTLRVAKWWKYLIWPLWFSWDKKLILPFDIYSLSNLWCQILFLFSVGGKIYFALLKNESEMKEIIILISYTIHLYLYKTREVNILCFLYYYVTSECKVDFEPLCN